MCIPAGAFVIGVSLFVLIFDIGHPSELRAFVFYAEVCVYVRACMYTNLPACIHNYVCICTVVLSSEKLHTHYIRISPSACLVLYNMYYMLCVS